MNKNEYKENPLFNDSKNRQIKRIIKYVGFPVLKIKLAISR
jgi:16S rRNA U516 pseudouridylate synthase RsuA-like enzyme